MVDWNRTNVYCSGISNIKEEVTSDGNYVSKVGETLFVDIDVLDRLALENTRNSDGNVSIKNIHFGNRWKVKAKIVPEGIVVNPTFPSDGNYILKLGVGQKTGITIIFVDISFHSVNIYLKIRKSMKITCDLK